MVPTFALIGELHRTAAMSAQPRFWSTAAEMLTELVREDELAVDCVTSVMFTWLREAALWEQRLLQQAESNVWTNLTQWLTPAASLSGRPVRLNIYDVSQSEAVQKINAVFAHQNAPVKLLGVFHAGVEVDGLEWSFGYIPKQTGVVCSKPRQHRQHHFRQTLELSHTQLHPDKIAHIISELIEEYPGEGYDLLRRNCCHFADDFCQRLGIGNIPGWVYRLARIAANVDTVLKKAQAVGRTARSMKNAVIERTTSGGGIERRPSIGLVEDGAGRPVDLSRQCRPTGVPDLNIYTIDGRAAPQAIPFHPIRRV